jgi:LmbE family N-acetylglucosaminyl deacetylase
VPAPLRLLCVLAHPDDESLGTGGILAKYAAEGVETFLITATRGEKGRVGTERPGPAIVGPLRETELRRAADVLGVKELHLLGYMDGELDQVEPGGAVAKIAALVRAIRPQVVVTFGADGSYGHVDHVAISQLTGAALLAAAAHGAAQSGADPQGAPHAVSKLYWMVESPATWAAYERAFGELVHRVDGGERRATPWPEWSITAFVDTGAYRDQVWRAVDCHQSQVSGYGSLRALSPQDQALLWREQTFYRVWSLVNGGRKRERDLFEGLR